MKALGLHPAKTPASVVELRYSSVVILTNQDEEGFQKRGMLLNFFAYYWPSICRAHGFIRFFFLPEVRCLNPSGLARYFINKEEYK